MKYIRDFVLLFAILTVVAVGAQKNTASAAESSITMTELYESGDYDTARKNASDLGQIVTVSSLEEFQMFRKACIEDKKQLAELSFVQTEDIIASNIIVSYEETSERILIKQDGKVTASIKKNQRQGTTLLYQGTTSTITTWEELGLSDAVNTSDGTPPAGFAGTYDGKGHRLQGFLGVRDGLYSSGMNSFFYFIKPTGIVQDVVVEDCLMMGCGAITYGMSGGSIQNCNLNRVCIYGETVGGFTTSMSNATIEGCTVKNSDCVLIRDYRGRADESYSFGCVGGIVGQLETGSVIKNCQVTDTDLYGVDDPSVYIGGIAGRTYGKETKTLLIQNCITDVSIQQSYYAGGLLGVQCLSTEINNCLSIAKMQLFAGDSVAGGAVGRIDKGESFVLVNTCSISSGEAYNSGGLIGEIQGIPDIFIFQNCLVLGMAKGIVKGALSVDAPSGREDSVAFCYVPKGEVDYFASGEFELNNCAMVTAAQLAGTEQTESILQTPMYAEHYSLVKLLNDCAVKYKYHSWVLSDKKYPIPIAYDNLPDLEQIEKEWSDLGDNPNVSPTPAPTPSPTMMPTTEPSKTPEPTETPEPTATVTPAPEPTNTPEPTATVTPAPVPTKTPEPDPTLVPIPSPTKTPSELPTPTKTPNTVTSSPGQSSENLWLQGMKVTVQPTKKVTIRWNVNKAADGIVIYQRTGKGKFRKIGQCSGSRTKFVWKRAKAGKKYTFRIQAYADRQGKRVYGKVASRRIQMPYLKTPVYRLSVGVNALHQKYMQITLKKYQGSHIEIYLKKEKGRFAKAAMRTNKIAPYKGKIRFTYQKRGTVYYCKLRTYRVQNGKKRYSGYSRILKICT